VDSPKVSIIILNWNGYIDTIECLESLKKNDYQNYEVIIVDNASIGDDVNILRNKYGDYVHIIANSRNDGFPGGCNIGMRYALEKGTDYILLLNNDTTVDKGFLTELVNAVKDDTATGIAGSKVYYYYHPRVLQTVGGMINWWLGTIKVLGDVEDVGQYETISERDFVYGTSFLLKKEVIEKISFMDETYFFGIEELDYCTRAKRARFKVVYVPKSKIWHKVGASFAKVTKIQFIETQKKIRKSTGFANYKYSYRLFKDYGPPVLFIFPFMVQTAIMSYRNILLAKGSFLRKMGIKPTGQAN
jgi:GT2 family glycosyltransferase